jgi:spore germination cell wall hydrolase CwlJ-like protein
MITLKLATALAALLIATTINTGTKPQQRVPVVSEQDIDCLAKNIYHEARGEPFLGQVAVALVTVNRVAHKKFHKTICKVVYANKQFSWTKDKHKKITDHKAWATALNIAKAVLYQYIVHPEFNAIYFHTNNIQPFWAKTRTKLTTIGSHVFYA